MWRIWFYPLLLAAGIAVYFGIDYLPQSWRDWLKGRKTHLVGWLGLVGPEIIDGLMQAQSLGLQEYLPAVWAKAFSQIVGVLAIVARMRTEKEKAG